MLAICVSDWNLSKEGEDEYSLTGNPTVYNTYPHTL